MSVQLQSARLVLRDWQKVDFEPYRKWNTGHHRWMDFDGPYYPKRSPEALEQEIERLKQPSSQIVRSRMVIADAESNQLLGTVNWYWESQETNWMSIGVAIYDDRLWGKGLGFEAMQLWCSHLFASYPELVRLDMRTWSGNAGLMRLADKLGFKLEARFRMARVVDGVYYDGLGYGVLRSEWEGKK